MRSLAAVLSLVLATALHADVFNVKVFGAAGDAVADDRKAIQDALDAIPEAGGVVYLPAGNYRITSTLRIKSRTTLRGDGPRATRIVMSDYAPADASADPPVPQVGDADLLENADQVTGNVGIVIEDLELDGNKENQNISIMIPNQVLGIDLRNVTDYTVQRTYIHDCVRDGIHVMNNSARGRIVDNTVRANGVPRANGGNGVSIPSAVDLIISRNIVTENNLSGIDLEKNWAADVHDELERITITDNVIRSNNGIGISSEGEAANPSRTFTITGNQLLGNVEGIRIQDTRGYVIANNTINESRSHGIFIVGAVSTDGLITGNLIHEVGPGRYGIYADSTQARITITGNNIQNLSGRMDRAIHFPQATQCTIFANTARGGTNPTQIFAPDASNLVSMNKTD